MVFRVPSYYKNFRCIADKCPDNCCRGWEIDIDEDTETLVGDDIDIEDIVWYGSVNSVADMAKSTGVGHTAAMKQLQAICNAALASHRQIFCLHTGMIQS